MFTSPGSIAFSFGSLSVHWYGIVIGFGIVCCYTYISYEMKRRKLSVDPIDSMAFWLILSGIVGARLYFVLFNPDYFYAFPLEIFAIWKGGLAIHGALIGGAMAFLIFILRNKLSFLLYADIIMPGVLLAQAIGRWGNFFNNEAYGSPTTLPWKLFIPPQFRRPELINFEYYHPTFLYESMWNLVGFAFLLIIAHKLHKKPAGTVLFSYLIWYSFGRFFIEGLRLDSLYFGQIRAAQFVSVVLFFAGIFGLIIIYNKNKLGKNRT